jgi:tetrapyrrole methylase family protein/MazG family protein
LPKNNGSTTTEFVKKKHKISLESLLDVMRRLRSPKGCPWDKKQTHASIRTFLLEEAYEALEAIQKKDWQSLKEELGDLLFQIVFHAQMAEEKGRFTMEDVIESLVSKLKSRHPHVFGNQPIKTAKEQTLHWDKLKTKEKPQSLLERVPKSMPALLQAFELQERAHRLGFKWSHFSELERKLNEELEELKVAQKSKNRKNLEEELGDVLFMLANYARWQKLNPEELLLKTNQKFRERFAFLEAQAKKLNRSLKDFPLEEMEKLWREAKKKKNERGKE